jgi:pimeloyl-ACP methyl ester carboxylesterase
MAHTLPTIVLVHGAWHTPPNYQGFVDSLKEAGFSVHCPRLPSCTNTSPPPASFADDVKTVRTVIKNCVEAGERVLMVMHSYGGAVGTDAVTDALLRRTRAAANQPGGVIHLLYLCAYMLQPGTSVIDIAKSAGFFPYWDQFVNNYEDGSCFPIDPATMFLGGGSSAERESAVENLVRSPLEAFNASTEGECWRKVPVTYVRTAQDGAVPTAYQDIMIERAEKDGVVIVKEQYDTHHSVFISKRKEMVELALKVAKDERNPQ